MSHYSLWWHNMWWLVGNSNPFHSHSALVRLIILNITLKSKPRRSCCDLTGTHITVILHQWTHKETIPGATEPFIYILMKCMSSNGGKASCNVPFNSRCIRRSSGAALAGICVDCQFISVQDTGEEEPCGSRPELLGLPLSLPDNHLSAVWDQVILGPWEAC